MDAGATRNQRPDRNTSSRRENNDEMIHLSSAESRHRGQDTERVAREEDDAVGVPAHTRWLKVVDVVDGVRHTRVLRLGHVGIVGLAVCLLSGVQGREGKRVRVSGIMYGRFVVRCVWCFF